MKSRFFILLVLILALCLSAATGESAFSAVDSLSFDAYGAEVTVYRHNKTGATVMFIQNEDTNRVFQIAFRTPAVNNTGVPHVFEHATLCGSEKYPSQDLFFNLSYQTYNTYMNASTYNFMTIYPIASLSEEQLLKYADFYTDSCFNPMIMQDESIFRQEAWRYTLTDKDSPLTITGTVYSEMQGADTLASAAVRNMIRTAMPGSTTGNESGGDPDYIPDLTWEDLKNYHDTYYHPSNSLTCIYGKIENTGRFLDLLDGYFSAYEQKDIVIEDAGYVPMTAASEVVFDYPMPEGSETEHGSTAYYAFVLGDIDMSTIHQGDFFTDLVCGSTSPYITKMAEALPYANPAAYIEMTTPEKMIVFSAGGINTEDAAVFKTVVDESLAEIAENGFDAEMVDAVLANVKLSLLLSSESSSNGVNLLPKFAYYWAGGNDLYGSFTYFECLDMLDTWTKDGTFTSFVKDHLVSNARTALVTTRPVPGGKEIRDAALTEQLAAIRSLMSAEEIDAIVAETAALGEKEPDDTSAMIRELTAVSVENLPEDYRVYSMTDETDENGVRRIFTEAGVTGLGNAMIVLDADGLTKDQLHYLKLFTDLAGSMDTGAHTWQEVSTLATRYLHSGTIKISLLNPDKTTCEPHLRAGFIALDEDYEAAYDLLYEILFTTSFEDTDRLLGQVSSMKTGLKNSISSNSYAVQIYRALSAENEVYAYSCYVNYLDYYQFLCETEAALKSDPAPVVAALRAVQTEMNNRRGVIAGFAGSAESAAIHAAAQDAFLARLGDHEVIHQDRVFEKPAASEAIIIPSNMQFNAVAAGMDTLGLEAYDAAGEVVSSIVSDAFLYPILRDQYGTYSVLHGFMKEGVYVVTYRDPTVTETFSVYDRLGEMVKTLSDMDQETINGYILNSYSGYAMSNGELSGAFSAMLNHLNNDEQDQKLLRMQQIKSVTPETLTRYADLYSTLAEKGLRSTSGSSRAISENAALYETVFDPFSVQAAANAEFSDVPEDHPAADMIRVVCENDLMSPVSETLFGADEPMTLGELAGSITVMLGGRMEPDAAIAALSGYGVMPAMPADTPLLREDLCGIAMNLYVAFGVEVNTEAVCEQADAAMITPGNEPAVAWAISKGWLNIGEDGLIRPQDDATRLDGAVLIAGLYLDE